MRDWDVLVGWSVGSEFVINRRYSLKADFADDFIGLGVYRAGVTLLFR